MIVFSVFQHDSACVFLTVWYAFVYIVCTRVFVFRDHWSIISYQRSMSWDLLVDCQWLLCIPQTHLLKQNQSPKLPIPFCRIRSSWRPKRPYQKCQYTSLKRGMWSKGIYWIWYIQETIHQQANRQGRKKWKKLMIKTNLSCWFCFAIAWSLAVGFPCCLPGATEMGWALVGHQ